MDLFNQDNEVAVLSLLLSNPDLIFSINSLKPFMFSATPNQIIFSAATEISEQGSIPEFNLLVNFLTGKDKLKEAGTQEYLNFLKNQNYKVENLAAFVDSVINAYKARTLISSTADMAKKLNEGNVTQTIAGLRHVIDTLEETSGGEQTSDMLSATRDTWAEIKGRIDNPGIRGISTGLRDLDMVTGGFIGTNYWIIASRPGMGKSASMINLAMSAAEKEKPALIFSLEMNKESLVERMLAIKTEIPISDIRLGLLNQGQLNKITEAIKSLKDLPIFIDSNFNCTLEYVLQTIRRYKKLHNVEVIFIDYVQLIAERGADQTAELGRISRGLKLLANELNITIVLYSQLSRGVESRDDKRPVLSDLRQSGNLEEDADLVIFLYRDEYYNRDTKFKNTMEWLIRKHRQGAVGSLFFKFEADTNLIEQG